MSGNPVMAFLSICDNGTEDVVCRNRGISAFKIPVEPGQ